MNAQRTKQLTTGCVHSNGEPGALASTTNISVRFAPDLIIRFRIENSMNTSIPNPPAGPVPRPIATRRLAAIIHKP